MIAKSLLKGAKITEVISATVTGTTNINGTVVDMANFEFVAFITSLGTAAANNGHKVQQGTTANASDQADLLGSSLLCNNAAGKVLMSEVLHPQERYVRPVVIRGTTTTINSVLAIQWGPRTTPIDNNVVDVQAAETHVSPAEGTA